MISNMQVLHNIVPAVMSTFHFCLNVYSRGCLTCFHVFIVVLVILVSFPDVLPKRVWE